MKNWTLDQLKQGLDYRGEVKGWIITQEHTHRRERYFLGEGPGERAGLGIDQDREVRGQSIQARVFVRLPRPGRQGEITKKLFPSLPLAPQLDAAIEAALQTDHQEWELPSEPPKSVPQPRTTDPRMAEDLEGVMRELTSQMAAAVGKKRPTRFNSAELFLSVHDRELHLSNGLRHRSSQSRIYAESAFSGKSDEYLNTMWSVSLADLSIPKLFDETAERAEHATGVAKPETGRYPVIVDSEVLATLFNGHIGQLSAFNAYSRLPFLKPGDELIPGARGDLLSIRLDPTLEFGADTVALSEQGTLQAPIQLVERNRVLATLADKQYADYLGVPTTTVRGNVVVEPGTLSFKELTKQAPKVIEVLQFSALFPDVNSGTFSSEIRLARLHDNENGKVTYLKGGSLSGSINENFKGIRLSRERVKRSHFSQASAQGYYGPEFAMLSDVSVVG